MIDFLIDSELPFVVILTKADKLSKTQLAQKLSELDLPYMDQITAIPCSAVTGAGIDEVKKIIDSIEEEWLEEQANLPEEQIKEE